MEDRRKIPVTGIALALAAGVVLAFSGAHWAVVLATMLVWIASLWIAAPPPPPPVEAAAPDRVNMTRRGMRDMIEHSAVPFLMLDGDRIVIANAAAREALGAHILEQDVRVAFRHPAAIALIARPDGGKATIHGLIGQRSIWDMSRKPIDGRYWLIELVDRTAEADVSRAHTDFVANASHELRTPLASIIGYVETMVDQGDAIKPERAQKFLGTVLREARRLQDLVEDLMSLSHVEAEKHEQPREALNLNGLVKQASKDGAGPDREDAIVLSIEDNVYVRGERKQLEQLVRNLVDNGLKYGAPDTKVEISLIKDERNMAVLSVRDHGEGIAPDHLPYLTRRFYRTDPGRSRAAGGTGLGLAIVKHIVERHRGQLDIASTLGEGTVVTVRIPLAEQEIHPVR